MRVRTVLGILVAVNVLWAAAFLGYMQRSTTPVIRPVAETASAGFKSNSLTIKTNPAPVVAVAPLTNVVAPSLANTNPPPSPRKMLASADKKFSWQDVTNDTYLDYIANLRSI